MMIFAGMHGSYPNSQVAYGAIYVDFLLFSDCFSTDFGVLWRTVSSKAAVNNMTLY